MSSNPPPERRIARTLTQKYDMHALRILQKLETEILSELGEALGVDEDEVDIELDLLGVYNKDKDTRKDALVEMFSAVTLDSTATIDKILQKMVELDETSHVHPTTHH